MLCISLTFAKRPHRDMRSKRGYMLKLSSLLPVSSRSSSSLRSSTVLLQQRRSVERGVHVDSIDSFPVLPDADGLNVESCELEPDRRTIELVSSSLPRRPAPELSPNSPLVVPRSLSSTSVVDLSSNGEDSLHLENLVVELALEGFEGGFGRRVEEVEGRREGRRERS